MLMYNGKHISYLERSVAFGLKYSLLFTYKQVFVFFLNCFLLLSENTIYIYI